MNERPLHTPSLPVGPADRSRVRIAAWAGVRRWLVAAITGIALCAGGTPTAWAQPLNPTVRLTHPAPAVHNAFDLIRGGSRAEIGLLYARQTADHVKETQEVVEQAVYNWELFLLGLGLPYRVLEEEDLEDGVSDEVSVLIVPAAEALSEGQVGGLQRFVERGGGLFASGRTAVFDERGRRHRRDLFVELFGATYDAYLPDNPSGLLQQMAGGHVLTGGLPMDYRLNLDTAAPIAAARPIESTGLGQVFAYLADRDVSDLLATVTTVLYGRRGTGAFVWAGFQPQDVSLQPEQQAVYQAFLVNALAYLASAPAVMIRPWPRGYQSATVLAALPMAGVDFRYGPSLKRVLDALDQVQAPATFFMTAEEARLFPRLLQRIAERGEIAVSADTDEMLKALDAGAQSTRLLAAREAVGAARSGAVRGVYPPGGFFDGNTLLALRDAKLHYLLVRPPVESAAPRFFGWADEIDYSRPLALGVNPALSQRDRLFPAVFNQGVPGSTWINGVLAMPMTGREDHAILKELGSGARPEALLAAYQEDFTRLHKTQGLFVLPFHAEIQAATSARADVLRQLASYAQQQRSWVTSLGAVSDWWRQKGQVEIAINSVSAGFITFIVQNNTSGSVEGLSVDLYPGRPVYGRVQVDGAEADVTVAPDNQSLTLTFASLIPGASRITVLLPLTGERTPAPVAVQQREDPPVIPNTPPDAPAVSNESLLASSDQTPAGQDQAAPPPEEGVEEVDQTAGEAESARTENNQDVEEEDEAPSAEVAAPPPDPTPHAALPSEEVEPLAQQNAPPSQAAPLEDEAVSEVEDVPEDEAALEGGDVPEEGAALVEEVPEDEAVLVEEVPEKDDAPEEEALAEIPEAPEVAVGALQVTTQPSGASVLLNGQPVGRTPLTLQDVAAGSQQVTLSLDGYESYTTSIAVASQQTSVLQRRLTQVVSMADVVAAWERPAPVVRSQRPIRLIASVEGKRTLEVDEVENFRVVTAPGVVPLPEFYWESEAGVFAKGRSMDLRFGKAGDYVITITARNSDAMERDTVQIHVTGVRAPDPDPAVNRDASAIARGAPETAAEESPRDPAIYSREGLNLLRGGYTWVVGSHLQLDAAEQHMSRRRRAGYRTDIVVEDNAASGSIAYRVAIGQFATEEEALEAREFLPEDVPEGTWLLKLPGLLED